MSLRPFVAAAIVAGVGACIDPSEPGTLVPPTVVDDARLPRIAITVGGHERLVHVRTYGDPGAPPLLVVHGSAGDMRAWKPLASLADRYHVVMWDLRGNGLSERVSSDELEFHQMAEEIEAVRRTYAGDRPATIVGHSWGAVFVALHLAKYPRSVYQAVLIEPPGLTSEFQNQVGQDVDLLAPGYLEMVWSSELLPPVDDETLDYRALQMLRSGVRPFSCDEAHPPDWPVWRVGGQALIVWEMSLLHGTKYEYDFSPGIDRFEGEALLVGTECSPIGATFQRETNLRLFKHGSLLSMPGVGHRLVVEAPNALLAGLRAFLDPGHAP